jgi:hypothetical protein
MYGRGASSKGIYRENMLEYALSLARDLAHSWPRGPHQYYLCATPPSGYNPYAFNPRTSYLIIYPII